MRIVCGFALVLGLTVPAVGMAWHQDQAASAAASGQPPSTPASVEAAPTEPAKPHSTTAEQDTSENANDKTTNAVPPSGTVGTMKKRRKRALSPPNPTLRKAPDGAPRKIVVREGGTSEPAAQIAPDISPDESARQRQQAEHSLGSTDDQLKQLAGRTLDAQQQESVAQIRNYMQGARSALKEGDVHRADTLAEKAHLLSDDLLKH
jgi:hypothetical protein